MKLPFPFIQLPLYFDADILAAEVAALDESEWSPHPQGFPGNSALPLIGVDGDPDNDGLAGPMRPTPFLARFPYLTQVLASFGAVLGRTRLMRLSGQAEVTPHVDQGHYWAERARVHVPIITQPQVRFQCGDAEINMAAGECWIFDTWRMHNVLNAASASRVHLVADTVGSEAFWGLVEAGRPYRMDIPGWRAQPIAPQPGSVPVLRFESTNVPIVMTPWELRAHVGFLLGETQPHALLAPAQQVVGRFVRRWQTLWAIHGEARSGFGEYRQVLDDFMHELDRFREYLVLRNGVRLYGAISIMVIQAALADGRESVAGEPRTPLANAPSASVPDAKFDRPVFIVSPPRSGSTLLFETLAKAPEVFTIGGESHAVFEAMPEFNIAASDHASNRLDSSVATPALVAELRARFAQRLVDRDGNSSAAGRVRFLEKTPKNALRIPLLTHAFAQAYFVYLHRDPRETLASMIEAWRSGQFVTYPQLPGWTGPAWSLLLIPGWRDLIGQPLHEIVATQWETTTRILLDDLEALPKERVITTRYADVLAEPQTEIARLCGAVDFRWDHTLGDVLPLSRHTLTRPDAQKWQRHAAEIDAVLPRLAATIARSERFAAR